MEVAPGVYQVPGVRGANIFLLASGDGLTLVDSGLPGDARAILRFIQALGHDTAELRRIILTHGHPDHTGSAKALRDATGAEVLIHTLDTRISGNGERQVHCPGIPYAVLPGAWRVAADQLLEDADDVDGLRVLHTPGHTPGGISLFAEELGVLFPGDLFTQRGRYISRSVPFPGTNLASYHASMERISRLPFSVACLGHGRTLTERARETLEGAAAWYAESPRWRRLLQSVPGPLRLGLSTGYRYR